MAQRVGAEAREPGNGTSFLLASTMRYMISTGIRASIRWLCMMDIQLAIRQLFSMNQYFFCLTLLPCIVHRLCRLQKPVMKVLTRKKTREICADLHRHGMIIGHHIYLYLLPKTKLCMRNLTARFFSQPRSPIRPCFSSQFVHHNNLPSA